MKNKYNVGIIIVLFATIVYLIILQFRSTGINNEDLSEKLHDLNRINSFNQNLINTENNTRQIEYVLNKKIDKLLLENADKTILNLNELVKNEPVSLMFILHENSCHSCIEIEFKNIENYSKSFGIPIRIICMSESWRFIDLLQNDYNHKNDFYRLTVEDKVFNPDLFIFPFYVLSSKMNLNIVFIPLKENPTRTSMFFNFIETNLLSPS